MGTIGKKAPSGSGARVAAIIPGWGIGSASRAGLAYVIGVAGTAALLIARFWIWNRFDQNPALILFLLPVILSAYVGGLAPGLVATVLSALGSLYFLIPRHFLFSTQGRLPLMQWLSLIALGSVVSILSEAFRREIATHGEAQLKLRASEERLDSVFTSAMDAIISVDQEQRITLFNPAAEKAFKISAHEMMGQPLDRFLPERFRSAHREHLRAFGEAHVTRRAMGQLGLVYGLRSDGAEFPIEASISHTEVAGRRSFTVILRDVTERQRAEQELRRMNRALRTITECNQVMVRAAEESHLLAEVCGLLVREGGYRMAWIGYREDDEGKSVRPTARAGFEEGYLQAVNITWADTEHGSGPTGRSIRTGKPVVSHNTQLDASVAPWREEQLKRGYESSIGLPILWNHQVLGALTIYAGEPEAFDSEEVKLLTELSNDLAYGIQALRTRAERQRAEEELRMANAYNRGLLEASLDPLVTISAEGKVTDVNAATEKATGLSRQELIGTDFSAYFTDADKARVGYQQVFRDGLVHDYELELRLQNGQIAPVLYNASVYRDGTGQVIGVFAAARDITQRKRAEEEVRKLNEQLEQRVRERTAELEAANKELEAFTYSVSHDLRAPLRHVDGFSKMLVDKHGAELSADALEDVAVIRESVVQMGTLIDDLLNLARVGRKQLSMEVTGLNSLVDEVKADLTRANPARAIEWKIATLPFVECDAALMKQVFINLLSNAVKFTRPRKPAVIEVGPADQDGARAVFVRDNGVGFSMKYANKLFGVFQRLHRSEDFEGTGVGLATVQRIIHKHGGRVWADAALDQGATFYFTLGTQGGAAAE